MNGHGGRIVFSCVVDRDPLFEFQGLLWAWSLTELAGVPAEDLVCHLVGGGRPAYRSLLADQGVRVRDIAPFGDRRYCNKIAQLGSGALDNCAIAVLCDTDTAFVADIRGAADPTRVRAKIVDLARPPFPVLARLYRAAGVPIPPLARPTFEEARTFVTNFNGGLYLIPGGALPRLGTLWAKWALWCLERAGEMGPHAHHADQVGFGLALAEGRFEVAPLDVSYNCSTHLGASVPGAADMVPRMVHYHARIDADGRLRPTGHAGIDTAIGRVNGLLAAHADDLRRLAEAQGADRAAAG